MFRLYSRVSLILCVIVTVCPVKSFGVVEVLEDFIADHSENLLIEAKIESYSVFQDNPASFAIDGKRETFWMSTNRHEGNIEVSLSTPIIINGVFWYQRKPLFIDIRTPSEYRIEVASEKKDWKTIYEIKGDSSKNILGRRTHLFDSTNTKFIRMIINRGSSSGISEQDIFGKIGVSIAEFGAFNFNKDKLREIWMEGLSYRIALEIDSDKNKKVYSLPMDFTLELCERDKEKFIPESVVVVAHNEKGQISYICPTIFLKDSRFTMNNAVGRLYWFAEVNETKEVRYYVYFNTSQSNNSIADVLKPFNFKVEKIKDGSAISIDVLHKDMDRCNVLDEEGNVLAQMKSSEGKAILKIKDPSPISPLLILMFTKNNKIQGQWILPSTSSDLECSLLLRWHTYRRDKPLEGKVLFENKSKDKKSGILSLWLEEVENSSRRKFEVLSERIDLVGEEIRMVGIKIPLDLFRSGNYIVFTQFESKKEGILSGSRADIEIVPALKPYFPFGIYGLPYYRGHRAYIDKHLKFLSNIGMNLVQNDPSTYLQDRGLHYGLAYDLRQVQFAYNFGGMFEEEPESRMIRWDGKYTKEVSSDAGPGVCYNYPEVQPNLAELVKKQIKDALESPAFSGRIVQDDDIHLDHESCYCPTCAKLFKEKTGLDMPEGPQAASKVSPGIVEDNEKWIQWRFFRFHTRAEIPLIARKAKDEIAPWVQAGAVHGGPFNEPNNGEYPPVEMAPYDVLASYSGDPVTFFHWGFSTDFIRFAEEARMGNKQKDLWYNAAIWGYTPVNPETKERIFPHRIKPPWLVRKGVFSMLTAGFKGIFWFTLMEEGCSGSFINTEYKDTQEEFRKLSQVLQQNSSVLLKLKPAPKPVGLLFSVTTDAYEGNYNQMHVCRGVIFPRCLKSHVPVEYVCEEELLEGKANKYQVLLISDLHWLRRSVYEKLIEYINKGGTILITENSRVEIPDAIIVGSKEESVKETVDISGAIKVKDAYEMVALAKKKIVPFVDVDNPNIIVREFEGNGVKYLFFYNAYTDRWNTDKTEILKTPVESRAVEGIVKLSTGNFYACDLFNHRWFEVDVDGKFKITLDGDKGALIALYAFKPTQLLCDVSKKVDVGKDVMVSGKLLGQQEEFLPGFAPVEINVFGPDGKKSEYGGFYTFEDGSLKFSFKTGINDPSGRWEVEMISSAIGLKARTDFQLVSSSVSIQKASSNSEVLWPKGTKTIKPEANRVTLGNGKIGKGAILKGWGTSLVYPIWGKLLSEGTLEFYAKLESPTSEWKRQLTLCSLSRGINKGDSFSLVLYAYPQNGVDYVNGWFDTGSGGFRAAWLSNSFSWKVGEWHHFAFVWKDGKLFLYINGNQFGNVNFSEGFGVGPSFNFNRGVIDEVVVFQRAIGIDEIKSHKELIDKSKSLKDIAGILFYAPLDKDLGGYLP